MQRNFAIRLSLEEIFSYGCRKSNYKKLCNKLDAICHTSNIVYALTQIINEMYESIAGRPKSPMATANLFLKVTKSYARAQNKNDNHPQTVVAITKTYQVNASKKWKKPQTEKRRKNAKQNMARTEWPACDLRAIACASMCPCVSVCTVRLAAARRHFGNFVVAYIQST